MCWSVPGRIKGVAGNVAIVEIAGLTKEVVIDLISNPTQGDYVLVHAGYAIQKVSESHANFTIDFFKGKLNA